MHSSAYRQSKILVSRIVGHGLRIFRHGTPGHLNEHHIPIFLPGLFLGKAHHDRFKGRKIDVVGQG